MSIGGNHTVSELRDLLNSYNYQQNELERAAQGAASQWIANNTEEYNAWKRDYDAWNSAYQPVRTVANTKLSTTFGMAQDITIAEIEYQALAKAFMPMGALDGRMRASSVKAVAPKYEQNPQPSAVDADQGAFKATDAGTQAMPDYVKKFVGNVAPGLAPKNSDSAAYKPLTTTQKVLIAAGAFFGLALFVKVAK